MKQFLSVLVIIVTVFGPSPSWGASFSELGEGNSSCGTWTFDRQTGQASGDEAWVLGFITGFDFSESAHRAEIVNTDENGIFGWIDNYCKKSPTNDITTASFAFWKYSGSVTH